MRDRELKVRPKDYLKSILKEEKEKREDQAKVSPENERSFTVFDQTTLAVR